MSFLLWMLAVIFVVGGLMSFLRGQLTYGLLLIVVGFLVGPAGTSIFV